MERWRDNGRAYALGLAVLSWLIAAISINRGLEPIFGIPWLFLPIAFIGSLGMFLGGMAAFVLTSMCKSRLTRISLMTPIVVGVGFIVGSAPFALLFFIGMIFAWTTGAAMLGVPILAVTVLWSSAYLAMFGTNRSEPSDGAPLAGDKQPYLTAILCGIPGIATIGVALLGLSSAGSIWMAFLP